jgi:hypothetical protein
MPDQQNRRPWAPLISLALSVLVMFSGLVYIYLRAAPKVIRVVVKIVDASTGLPIRGAEVRTFYSAETTDEQGLAIVPVHSKGPRESVRFRIVAGGYRTKALEYSISGSGIAQFSLERLETSLSATGYTATKTMEAISGVGANWGPTYQICSDPGRSGYRVVRAEFQLNGDRHCGAWSECQEVQRNGSRVCWEFRLQGHSERSGEDSLARGTGVLTVTFESLADIGKRILENPIQVICHFYGVANQGQSAWSKNENCTIANVDRLDTNYHQQSFTCCGGGATSPMTIADIPAGLEIEATGTHYWSVSTPRLVGNLLSLHTYCGPEAPPGPGCNVNVEVIAHYRKGSP